MMDNNINQEMRQITVEIKQTDFAQFKSGDPKAFQRIFNIYYKTIYYYAIRFVKNNEEAEELVQESFIMLFLNRTKIDTAAGIYPYLFTIVKRFVISNFRKKLVESKFDTYLENVWCEGNQETEELVASKELSSLWNQAVASLPSKQKEIYSMSKFEGMSYQEIADKIGISKNTVKNHLLTASKTVKLIMKDSYLFLIFLFF